MSLYRRLFRKGVELTAHHDLRDIRDGVVTLFNYYNQRERRIERLDQVVIVTAPIPNDAMLAPLRVGANVALSPASVPWLEATVVAAGAPI